ncbi:hypothetical protein R6Q59_033447, partial [Mikania micrantha]
VQPRQLKWYYSTPKVTNRDAGSPDGLGRRRHQNNHPTNSVTCWWFGVSIDRDNGSSVRAPAEHLASHTTLLVADLLPSQPRLKLSASSHHDNVRTTDQKSDSLPIREWRRHYHPLL